MKKIVTRATEIEKDHWIFTKFMGKIIKVCSLNKWIISKVSKLYKNHGIDYCKHPY